SQSESSFMPPIPMPGGPAGGCIAYAELGDPDPGSNGEIYCGAVLSQVEETVVEQDHIQARTTWHPGFVYWFGASWSKAGIAGLDTWQKILGKERERVLAPLQVRVR
ncbi:MAG: DUF4861 family protein, partial [Bacteroidales bacterium]|nr:DUF4861 family protein [Bacteroidales bacterium]